MKRLQKLTRANLSNGETIFLLLENWQVLFSEAFRWLVVAIKVGAATETEMKDRNFCLEDAD